MLQCVLQCVAVCCSVLQCVAVCCRVCSVLQRNDTEEAIKLRRQARSVNLVAQQPGDIILGFETLAFGPHLQLAIRD